YLQHTLVLLLLICALAATSLRGHIALLPVRTVLDDRVSEGGQPLANALLLVTSYYKWQVDQGSGVAVQNASLPVLWMIGFAILIAINLHNLARPAAGLASGGRPAAAALCVPLYANMALISG